MSLSALVDRARRSPARIVLAGLDNGFAETIAGRRNTPAFAVQAVIGSGGVDPENHQSLGAVADLLRRRKPNQVRDGIHALDLAADPLRFAAGLVALGEADGFVAGPGVPAELLAEVSEWTLGPPPEGGLRSVHWLMIPDGSLIAMADCLFAPSPGAHERAAVALAVARAHRAIGQDAPRVAFLAGPPATDDGSVAEAAAAESVQREPGTIALADRQVRLQDGANVLIFPGSAAGYLALRTARQLAGALLLGPLLLGPPGAIMGVAEDATEEEMAGTVALAALIAGGEGT